MKLITITRKNYSLLKKITAENPQKEACAFVFAKIKGDTIYVGQIVEVRNTRRINSSFGISESDFKKHSNGNLIGLFHSHFFSPTLSDKDKDIFKIRPEILFQLIGLCEKNTEEFHLYGFTNTLNNLKTNIL